MELYMYGYAYVYMLGMYNFALKLGSRKAAGTWTVRRRKGMLRPTIADISQVGGIVAQLRET